MWVKFYYIRKVLLGALEILVHIILLLLLKWEKNSLYRYLGARLGGVS